jgi:hypothetical protein
MIQNLNFIWKKKKGYKNFTIKHTEEVNLTCIGEYKRIFYLVNRLFLNANFFA